MNRSRSGARGRLRIEPEQRRKTAWPECPSPRDRRRYGRRGPRRSSRRPMRRPRGRSPARRRRRSASGAAAISWASGGHVPAVDEDGGCQHVTFRVNNYSISDFRCNERERLQSSSDFDREIIDYRAAIAKNWLLRRGMSRKQGAIRVSRCGCGLFQLGLNIYAFARRQASSEGWPTDEPDRRTAADGARRPALSRGPHQAGVEISDRCTFPKPPSRAC